MNDRRDTQRAARNHHAQTKGAEHGRTAADCVRSRLRTVRGGNGDRSQISWDGPPLPALQLTGRAEHIAVSPDTSELFVLYSSPAVLVIHCPVLPHM